MRFIALAFWAFLPGHVVGQSLQPDSLITYKTVEGADLNLHVFHPDEKNEYASALVLYFGGGWNGGSPSQFYPHADHFASLGMVVFAVEYRTRDSHETSPFESVEDAMSAMRWIRSHAPELGIDPNRIVAGGGSAGGHLAAATAMLSSLDADGEDLGVSRKPNALILFNPVLDNGPSGYGYERIGDRFKEFSPFHNIDASVPPITIFLGTEDSLVPVETIVFFQRAIQAAGGRCDVHLYGGQPHGFFNYRNGTNIYYEETVQAAEVFLRSLGFID